MGREQHSSPPRRSPSTPRFPPRTCHRAGCGRKFLPRSWNQRYCQEPECLRKLRRWDATKRQRRRRQEVEKRKQHAEAERQRRHRRRDVQRASQGGHPPPPPASQAPTRRAWSRSEKIPHDFCDRPGCYEPLPGPRRGPTQYCGRGCARAQRRVNDRERKFKQRRRKRKAAPRRSRRRRKPLRRVRRSTPGKASCSERRRASGKACQRVRSGGQRAASALSSRDRTELPEMPEEVWEHEHDSETSPGHRPRAPPSG
jgi:hypothetical protein